MSSIFVVSPDRPFGRPKLIGIGITKCLIDNVTNDFYEKKGLYYIIDNLDISNRIYFSPDKAIITKEEFETYKLLLGIQTFTN